MTEKKMIFVLSEKERDVVIAALRMWQQEASDNLPTELREIALNGREATAGDGQDCGLATHEEIDVLIEEHLNSDGVKIHMVNDDDQDVLVVCETTEEALDAWRGYYELDEDELPAAVLRLELTREQGAVYWNKTDEAVAGFFEEVA